jgi:glycine betaine/proline transport system substrate-binding protein
MKKMVVRVVLVVLAFAIIGGCNKSEKGTVRLTYVNWEEGVAWTHLFTTILEDEMGYEVELTRAEVGPAYSSVAAGDQDFFMEAWLPNLHANYVEGENYVEVSTIYENAVVGLIVPEYMAEDGVTALSDLTRPEVVEKLKGQIIGIDPSAGMMIKTKEELIPKYGLDEAGIELVPSSGPRMMAALKSAIEHNEYIVGMGWQPHSMFGRFDLVILEQDGERIWEKNNVYILGRPGVDEDLPKVVEFFDNAMFTNETIGSLMVHIADSDLDTLEAAREWKNENEDVWKGWIPAK